MEVCELHGEMMATINRLERKIDKMEEGRVGIARSVAVVQKTIDNGLRGDIQKALTAIVQTGEECRGFNNRLQVLEGFSWFREWVTDLRTNLFKNTMKIIFIVIIGLLLFHVSDTLMREFIKSVVS